VKVVLVLPTSKHKNINAKYIFGVDVKSEKGWMHFH
jgi:hypothetical protein